MSTSVTSSSGEDDAVVIHRDDTSDNNEHGILPESAETLEKERKSKGQILLSMLKARKFDNAFNFLDHPLDCNVTDEDGNRPLHLTLTGIHDYRVTAKLIKALLAGGANPNLKNHRGQTALHLLTSHPHRDLWDFSSLLLKAGANIEARDNEGKTWLFRMSGSLYYNDDLQKCIDLGARPDPRDFTGRTMLHEAIKLNDRTEGKLEKLINIGVNPKDVDYSGNTLFHEAVLSSAGIKTLEELSKLGLDLGQANYAGRTPVRLLCSMGQHEPISNRKKYYIKWVLSRSKNIDTMDYNGITPFHLASTISECLVDSF
jgi:ankyrin repeat protein